MEAWDLGCEFPARQVCAAGRATLARRLRHLVQPDGTRLLLDMERHLHVAILSRGHAARAAAARVAGRAAAQLH